MNDKKLLWDEWKNPFSYWIKTLRSDPIKLIKSIDLSRIYEMSECHVFELEDGRFALITEEGCSCYSSSDAEIDIFPTEKEALAAMRVWEKGQKEE